MKKHYQYVAAGLLALGLSANNAMAADGSNFTGFKLGVTAGWQKAEVDYSGFLAGRSQSGDEFLGGLNAGYGFSLGQSAVLTVGATYDLTSTELDTIQYNDSGTVDLNGKIKNHASLYIAPGVRVGSNWLAYAKVAYHRAKSDFTDSKYGHSSRTHDGFGGGVGVAYALTSNIELNVEAHYAKLSKESFQSSQGEPKLTTVTLGANYRF